MAFFNYISKLALKVKFGVCKMVKKTNKKDKIVIVFVFGKDNEVFEPAIVVERVEEVVEVAEADEVVEFAEVVEDVKEIESVVLEDVCIVPEPVPKVVSVDTSSLGPAESVAAIVASATSKSTFTMVDGDLSIIITRKIRKPRRPTADAQAQTSAIHDEVEFSLSAGSEPICFARPRRGYKTSSDVALSMHSRTLEVWALREAGCVSGFTHSAVLDSHLLGRARSMARQYPHVDEEAVPVKSLIGFYESLKTRGAISSALPKLRIPAHLPQDVL